MIKAAVDVHANPLFVTDHCSADATTLAVQILGGGMDHQIGAQLERPLQGGRAEAVIHHQQDIAGMGQFGQRPDIG